MLPNKAKKVMIVDINIKNFSEPELSCKCGCGSRPGNYFLACLQLARDKFGLSIPVSSGGRCEKYNSHIGGHKKSRHIPADHEKGGAVDIPTSNMSASDVLDLVKRLDSAGFTHIKLYSKHAHTDMRANGKGLVYGGESK